MEIPADVQKAVDEAAAATEDPVKQEFLRGYLRYRPETMSVEDFAAYAVLYEAD